MNVWGPQLYLLEQHGFRRIVSTTFMMAFMFPRHVDSGNVERYMRSLVRAQADIDMQPEQFKHHFINEIPERFRDKVDVRRFGVAVNVWSPSPIHERCLKRPRPGCTRATCSTPRRIPGFPTNRRLISELRFVHLTKAIEFPELLLCRA